MIDITEDDTRVPTIRSNGGKRISATRRRLRAVFDDSGVRIVRIAQPANAFVSHSRNFVGKLFDSAVDALLALEPDIVVHCGGIVGEGTQGDYDLAARRILEIDLPFVVSPSGRDMNHLGYELFDRYLGRLDSAYESEDLFPQGVSSFQYDSPVGVVGTSARERLWRELERTERKAKGVFLHHDLVSVPHSRNKGLLEDAGDFLRDLVDAEVGIALTGTSSHPHAVQAGRTAISNSNSTSGMYRRSAYGNSFVRPHRHLQACNRSRRSVERVGASDARRCSRSTPAGGDAAVTCAGRTAHCEA